MRIGILTQPLHGNYGGLLQNYALQQTLISLGHQPVTLDRHFHRPESTVKNIAKAILRVVKPQYGPGYLTASQRNKLIRHQLRFTRDNIISTSPIYTQEAFESAATQGVFDAFIVGSDQCWRPIYSPSISNYFLDFVTDPKVRKIAYAASFGTDKWELSDAQTAIAAPLAQRFDALSVREQSAVGLCRDKLGAEATWVLDPTMLLGPDGFRRFVTSHEPTGVTNYLLEDTSESRELLRKAVILSGQERVTNNLKSPVFHRFDSLESHVDIPVEQWVSNIANASLLVTDSFHGAVFAIMFNVPFIVKLNGVRGNTRLHSLLADFALEQCLCTDVAKVTLPSIDWDKVNAHLADRRNQSLQFLTEALK
ncbi:MAG: polysaccharide pyruvyl transferase family protein [Pseudoflavonifractor sp.]|nr:polysaccharide pyruvyl transferase family protein [Alloprevotella sp.]MCM1116084.1 polysaccharide pyruvyl transferase family protein [Pseudoflavonifractor sp.]